MTALVEWRAREPPLPPSAVLARGEAARRLAARLLQLSDEALAKLRGAAAPELLVLLGAPGELPWADGVDYFGRDERAPALLLPTLSEPRLHPALLERALCARHPLAPPPLLVSPAARLVVPAGAALPLERAELLRWLGEAP